VNEVLNVLIKQIDKWRDSDFVAVRNRWMELAIAINENVTYHERKMKLIGLNDDGALVLRDGSNYLLTYGDEIDI